MAVHRSGSGPDVVLFHGGMGSWRHWIRNVEPLAARFTVHALDHPSYGASAPGAARDDGRRLPRPRRTSSSSRCSRATRRCASPASRSAAPSPRTSPGASAPRVTHLCLVSPAGFPARSFGDRPTRSYKEAGDDERALPGDLPPQPARQHAERSREPHRGGGGHPGRLRPSHPLQQPQGERRRARCSATSRSSACGSVCCGASATTPRSGPPIS